MKDDKAVYITEKKFNSLINKIISQGQKELEEESVSSEIRLVDMLASTKALLELKSRIFFEDNNEE